MRHLTLVRLFLGLSLFLGSVVADVRVRGHFRKDGTYVAPHMRSSPNSTTLDNWSTKGNINPYTGQVGNKTPVEGVGVGNQYTPHTPTRSVQTSSAEITPPGSSSVSTTSSSREAPQVTSTAPTRDQWKKFQALVESLPADPKPEDTRITKEEVERLLGKPTTVSKTDSLTIWFYDYEGGVIFQSENDEFLGFQLPKIYWSEPWSKSALPTMTSRDVGEAELKVRISKLEEKVSRLESLLQQRKAIPTENSSLLSGLDPSTRTSANQWSQISQGMPKSEVRRILGAPSKIANNGSGEKWHYPGGGWIEYFDTGNVFRCGGYSYEVTP